MSTEGELFQLTHKVAALERDNGRLEARCGELAAEVALVKEANGCLQERLAALENDRQTGTLPPSTGNSTADFERRAKNQKPGWEPRAETAYDGGPAWSHQAPIAVEGQNRPVDARAGAGRLTPGVGGERGTGGSVEAGNDGGEEGACQE